jgi:hypothetical protein
MIAITPEIYRLNCELDRLLNENADKAEMEAKRRELHRALGE